jgi:glycosyltransferase involved in cell wall biosynthesis
LFLSTSDEEGFPNTFLQAWAAGTPVVSLTIDPDNLIKRNVLGKVSGTIERAITDIKELIGSPETREAISSRVRRYAANNHSPSAVAEIVESAVAGSVSAVAVEEHTVSPV